MFSLGLIVTRMALTGGTNPVEYLKAFNITLFLTSYENQVNEAIRRGTSHHHLILGPTGDVIVGTTDPQCGWGSITGLGVICELNQTTDLF